MLLSFFVSESWNHDRNLKLNEDANGYVTPDPVPAEADESGYMRVDRQLELAEDGHGYVKPMSKLEASVLTEEANYSEIKSHNEKHYVNRKCFALNSISLQTTNLLPSFSVLLLFKHVALFYVCHSYKCKRSSVLLSKTNLLNLIILKLRIGKFWQSGFAQRAKLIL